MKPKRFFNLLLTLVLILTLLPVTARAAGPHTDWDNSVGWGGISPGETIVLKSGFTGHIEIPTAITALTIDGGGQTLTGVNITAESYHTVTLTIKDLNITAPDDKDAIELNDSTLNVQGVCTITGGNTVASVNQSAIYGCKLIVNVEDGASLTAIGSAGSGNNWAGSGIYVDGGNGHLSITVGANATLNAVGGACTGGTGPAGNGIYTVDSLGITIKAGGTLNATGGDNNSGSAGYGIFAAKAMTLDFATGSSLSAIGGKKNGVLNGYGVFAHNNLTISGTPASINVQGERAFYVDATYTNSTSIPELDGIDLQQGKKLIFPAPMITPGSVCKIDYDGYTTLADALAAAEDSDTIVLLENITHESTIALDEKYVQIDLNSHNLTVNRTGGTAVSLTDALLVLTDSATGGECIINGNIGVDNGTFSMGFGVIAEGGTVNVTGDITVTATGEDSIAVGIVADDGAIVTVTGNVSATADGADSEARGVWANDNGTGSEVTISGTITVSGETPVYIMVGDSTVKAQNEGVSNVTKPGYLEYTDNTNFVWVATVKFTAQNSVNLRSPVNLVLKTEQFGLLTANGCAFENIKFSLPSKLNGGNWLYPADAGGVPGLAYDPATGVLTVPAATFGMHSQPNPQGGGQPPLTPGTYVATIAFSDGSEFYAAFTLTDSGPPSPPSPPSGGEPPTTYDKHVAYLIGYPDGTVHPDEYITRAEAAEFFFRVTNDTNKNIPVTSELSDLVAGAWYYQAVAYLEKAGVITGYPDGTFLPNGNITRAEFAAIAARFAELDGNAPQAFPDVANEFWAAKYINGAAAKGYIEGYPNGKFMPGNFITRAEAIAIINRILERKTDLNDIPAGANKFKDIDSKHWAYPDIVEASVDHEYTRKENGFELWQ